MFNMPADSEPVQSEGNSNALNELANLEKLCIYANSVVPNRFDHIKGRIFRLREHGARFQITDRISNQILVGRLLEDNERVFIKLRVSPHPNHPLLREIATYHQLSKVSSEIDENCSFPEIHDARFVKADRRNLGIAVISEMPGVPMSEFIGSSNCTPRQFLSVSDVLLQSLRELHARGITHLDPHWNNVFVRELATDLREAQIGIIDWDYVDLANLREKQAGANVRWAHHSDETSRLLFKYRTSLIDRLTERRDLAPVFSEFLLESGKWLERVDYEIENLERFASLCHEANLAYCSGSDAGLAPLVEKLKRWDT